jgi:octaprenyl-diphosphate synthase
LIGLCFQIRDDIFDYYDDAAIGKPRGKDMAEGKLTLPVIAALKLSQSAEAKEVAFRVKQGESTPEEREWLVEFTKENGGITYAEQKMQELSDEARQIVAGFSNEAVKNSLISYIDVVVGRNY